uniref:NB-ARC domain-containing protein n=1 Tax=Oryza nivara TaxID=4536 RepID=A0A0E0J354_ORYNI
MQTVKGAMVSLLPKWDDLLTEEYKLQTNLKNDIRFLKDELECMEAALLKVSEAPIDQPPDNQVKLWARDVKDLSYDIEDSIDEFMVCVNTHVPNDLYSFRGFCYAIGNFITKAKHQHKIGTDIKQIKSQIKEVRERHERNKVDGVAAKPMGPTVDSLRLSALCKRTEELVNIAKKRDELVRWLMEGDDMSKKQLRIVSIVGFGGLGKTTLAKAVYDKLKMEFNCFKFAFVPVSQYPNMVKIFKDMLDQLDKDKHSDISQHATWDEARLIIKLGEFLRDKRYLVVVDDIWDTSTWEKIKYSLSDNENRSRIIMTTRIRDVAEQAGGVYQLAPLSVEDSRKLFYLRLFGAEDKCPNQLAEVSENILKKCGGVPLAIITIASVLASKSTMGKEDQNKYWSRVYDSMGSGLEDNTHVYYIAKKHLIRLWVCEGFIHKEQGKSMYQVGEDYFNELMNKSLIQPLHFTLDGKVGTCVVHDMVHDLITSLSNEEHFVTTCGHQCALPTRCKVRRLSLQTSYQDSLDQLETMSLSHTRSLIVHREFKLLPTPLSKTFPVLRVLCLTECKQVKNQHVKDICNLLHLRSLDLWGASITELPKEIKNLRFLKVLCIAETGIKELPSTFVQLEQLECLIFYPKMRLPDGLGNLKSLQELGGDIIVDSPTMLDDLGRLTELRRLSINFKGWWNKSYETAFLQCLAQLTNLWDLQITTSLPWGPQQRQIIDNIPDSSIHSVPNWQASLSSLSTLTIRLKTLIEGDLQVLGSLPSLRYLNITVEEPTLERDERLTIGDAYPFMGLKCFSLYDDAMEVAFAKGAMPKLRTLSLRFEMHNTKELFGGDMDLGLENLSSLQDASIQLVNCHGAVPEEIEAVEDALRKAVTMNPNNPTLRLQRQISTVIY